MLQLQLSPSLSSVANVSKRSPRNGLNGVECGTDDRGNDTSMAIESDWITNASDSVIKIDDSGYENGSTSNASRNEIESNTIVTQNTSDTYDCNDG